MASAQHRGGIRVPQTPDDIIAMVLNIAFHSGDLDIGIGTQREGLSATAEHMGKAIPTGANGSDDLERAVERINNDHELVKQQTRLLQDRSTNALRIDTALEVHRRMVDAGMPNNQLERLSKKDATLYHKIVELHRLKHPVASSPQAVSVYMWVKGLEDKIVIRLPVKSSWEQARFILHNILLVRDIYTQNEHDDGKASWMYKTYTKSTKGNDVVSSVGSLACDEDYNKMIGRILARNTTLIKQTDSEISNKSSDVKPGLWDDEESATDDEIMDENGQLYFDMEFKAGWFSTAIQPNLGRQAQTKSVEPRRSARISNSVNQDKQATVAGRPKTYFEQLDEDLGICRAGGLSKTDT